MSRIVVIDSSFGSMMDIDYEAAKASGVDGVILHAGYGSDISQKDPSFNDAYNKAKEAGMLVGAFWFMYARNEDDARLEAKVCNEALAGTELELGVYYDYEEDSIDYMDRSGGSKDGMTERIIAFIEELKSLGHDSVGFYTNTNCFNGAHGAPSLDADQLTSYPFWHAHYNGNEQTDEPGTTYNGIYVAGHQFANNDMVPEWIRGCPNVDVSIFEFDINKEETTTEDESTSVEENSSDETNNEVITYTVESGDCLSVIADKFGVSVDAIVELNGIEDANLIYAGDVLNIPGAEEKSENETEESENVYIVESGDTLWGIADKLLGDGARYQELASANGIEDASMIYPGQELRY